MATFALAGGTIWLHRLTGETPFLKSLSQWTGQPVEVRKPTMWLQQLETSLRPSPLLNGINDFFTCWAAFCWTNGNMNSVRTTAIVDSVISAPEPPGESLLNEPSWTGKWNFSETGPLVTQAILTEVGCHTRNSNPGSGLAVLPIGPGIIVIDQLRWRGIRVLRSTGNFSGGLAFHQLD